MRRWAEPLIILGLLRSQGGLSRRLSPPRRLDLTCAGSLEQGEASARGFLRIQVALSFELDLQTFPFVRIDRLEVRSLELAIGGGLRREQRRVRSPDFRFGVSIWFGVSTAAHGSPDRRRLAFMHRRAGLTLYRIARAAGKRHRAQDEAGGQKFRRERFQAGTTRRSASKLTAVLGTQRCTDDRHANESG